MTRKRPAVQPCGERHPHYVNCMTCNPPPPEQPGMLRGPELGPARYIGNYQHMLGSDVVKVIARSYVWAPGDPAYRGGSRRYDDSVIEYTNPQGKRSSMVVDDKDLAPMVVTIHPPADCQFCANDPEQCHVSLDCEARAWANGFCGPHQPDPASYH